MYERVYNNGVVIGAECFETKVYFLEGCDRKNPKRFREFVERMNRNAERIAKAFRTQKFNAVWDYV